MPKKPIEIVNGWPNPDSLPHNQLVSLVMEIQGILWAGEDGLPDPNKEWSNDEIEAIADCMINAGLMPKDDE